MAVKVVDASALAALIFGEPEASRIAVRLASGDLVAPAILPFELANVCVTKMRRNPRDAASILAAFAMGGRFAVEERWVDREAVIRLGVARKLSAYDSSYLWLSRYLDAELVTLDQRLMRAFEARGAP